jgi:DNA-binding response OmpR family regulator
VARERTVLVVDDDEFLREVLADQLCADGEFVAILAASIGEGLMKAQSHALDLIILDVGLPDGDGRDLCVVLRKRGLKIPIVFLTGLDSEADAAKAIEVGGNDYITKPFKWAVLLARLRAQVCIFDHSIHAVLHVGPYRLQVATRLLLDPVRNRCVHLTKKEAALLRLLALHPGQTIARQILLGEIWGHGTVSIKALPTLVCRLRQKLEVDPANACLLLTERGGYRLAVE